MYNVRMLPANVLPEVQHNSKSVQTEKKIINDAIFSECIKKHAFNIGLEE